jgi:hypothetical protein
MPPVRFATPQRPERSVRKSNSTIRVYYDYAFHDPSATHGPIRERQGLRRRPPRRRRRRRPRSPGGDPAREDGILGAGKARKGSGPGREAVGGMATGVKAGQFICADPIPVRRYARIPPTCQTAPRKGARSRHCSGRWRQLADRGYPHRRIEHGSIAYAMNSSVTLGYVHMPRPAPLTGQDPPGRGGGWLGFGGMPATGRAMLDRATCGLQGDAGQADLRLRSDVGQGRACACGATRERRCFRFVMHGIRHSSESSTKSDAGRL